MSESCDNECTGEPFFFSIHTVPLLFYWYFMGGGVQCLIVTNIFYESFKKNTQYFLMHDINKTAMTVKKFYKLNVHTYIMYYPLYKAPTPLLTNNNKKFIIMRYFVSEKVLFILQLYLIFISILITGIFNYELES